MRTLVLALLAAGVALAGCGGSSSDTASTRGATATAAATGTTTAVRAGRASESATTLLAEMRAALSTVKSYHVEGTGTDEEDGKQQLSADVKAPDSARLTLTMGGLSARMIVKGADAYIKADKAFWKHNGGSDPAVIALLAGHWIKAPSAGTQELIDQLLPEKLARCTARNAALATVTGTTHVDGKPAVVLRSGTALKGSGEPDELVLAATGPALPLRIRQLERKVPDREPDPSCGDDPDADDTTITSDLRFTRFDEPLTIDAPANPLDLSKAMSDRTGKA